MLPYVVGLAPTRMRTDGPHGYVPHESEVMQNLVKRLDENGVVEEEE